jgi:zinc D-Ala-D-Ala dipeptidase
MMKKNVFGILVFVLLLSGCGKDAPWLESGQCLVVITEGWDSTAARVYQFERAGEAWQEIRNFSGQIGRNGMAWGRGLHKNPKGEKLKEEGDGRSPAGIFALGTGFGKFPLTGMKWPYFQADSGHRCVDDPKSRYYNQIVHLDDIAKTDWDSAEKLLLSPSKVYDMAFVIEHNSDPVVPGGGSAIFFHIWNARRSGTAGCVSVSNIAVRALLYWLDPEAKPFIVILPREQYLKYQASWQLPKLAL